MTTIDTETSPTIVQSTGEQPISRRSRRRLSHQRQQERIQAMKDATESMAVDVESNETLSTQSSGVLQAMQGTVQGQTGWYQTAQGEAQYWQIADAGHWNRVK